MYLYIFHIYVVILCLTYVKITCGDSSLTHRQGGAQGQADLHFKHTHDFWTLMKGSQTEECTTKVDAGPA